MRHTHKLTRKALTISALALSFIIAGWQAPTLLAYSTKAVRSVFTNAPSQPAKPELKAAAKSLATAQETLSES